MTSIIVNFSSSSFKHHSELKSIRKDERINSLASVEFQSGKGANQICTLQRAGVTRWSSYFALVSSLIEMFSSITILLEKMIDNGLNSNICREAKGAYKEMKSFKFVFILHLMNNVLGL